MEYVVFGRWQLETEREATRRAYAHLEAGGPERCGCAHCRNFAAARMEVYPVKVHRLFEDLGIDFTKEAEVYHMVRLRPGLHQYGGWFHCVGRVESETEEAGQFDIEAATGLFSLYFHDKPALVPACFQGLPLLQLEFNAQVAWVLQEPEAR